MKPPLLRRRHFTAGLLLSAATLPPALRAQPRLDTLRLLVGYPPGGSADLIARKLAERLTGRLAATAVVDNKPGAAGRLAVDELKRSPADGSVLLITPASIMTLYPHVFRQLSYDPLTDVAPVSTVASTGFSLAVGPKVPASVASVDDLVRWCRANPAAAQCGNAGAGSMQHFLGLMMERELKLDLTHVPYRGGSAAMQAVAGGELAMSLSTEAASRPMHQAGRLRVLATLWPERSPFYPQVPTFRELGYPGLAQQEWFGAFLSARTPQAVVQATAEALSTALASADVRETWDKVGVKIDHCAPSQLQTTVRREIEFWGPVVKASGFTPES